MTLTVLYTTVIHQEVITFADVAEKCAWEAEVMAIKEGSTQAFNKKEQDGLTSDVRVLYDQWMAKVLAFKEQFGENRTPNDIKWALNSAEQALGVSVTQWQNPPNNATFE